MSITVNLLTFSKRRNSTKQPSAAQIAAGASLSCTLMDDTSLMNPTFKLNVSGNPVGYNYCYVPSFERYFFINNWRSFQGFWYAECTCDVMASWKTEIGGQSHYVLRAASDYDGDISDDFYSAKITAVNKIQQPAGDLMSWRAPTSPYTRYHSYVLGIVGLTSNTDKQIGSLCYYHMDETYLNEFLGYLMDNVDDWSDLSGEYSPGVQQALLNPMQYIKSCVCLPISPPSISASGNNIHFGYYTYHGENSRNFAILDNWSLTRTKATTVDIPKHPQAATRGNYLNCQPFSEYYLHFGPWGDIPLDPMLMQRNSKLSVGFKVDLTSGDARLIVEGFDYADDYFFNGTANIGVDVNLSQISVDGLAVSQVETNSIYSMLGSALSPLSGGSPVNAAIGIMQAATAGIQDSTRLSFPQVSGLSNGGSFLPYQDEDLNMYLSYKYKTIVDENLAEIGRPLCQVKQINTLSGFILCQLADAHISGTADETDLINTYLNTGFFYE